MVQLKYLLLHSESDNVNKQLLITPTKFEKNLDRHSNRNSVLDTEGVVGKLTEFV